MEAGAQGVVLVITLYCPSRGRSAAGHELRASFNETVVLPDTRLVFLLDDDDPAALEYPWPYVVERGDGTPTGPLNRAAMNTVDSAILGFVGDDSRCATKGWDREVTLALREPGFAWGPDETGPEVWPSTAFVSREIVQAIGYFVLPGLKRGFFDRQWISVARAAGLERKLKSSFPHDNADHPVARDIIAADEVVFSAYGAPGVERDASVARHIYELQHFFPPRVMA